MKNSVSEHPSRVRVNPYNGMVCVGAPGKGDTSSQGKEVGSMEVNPFNGTISAKGNLSEDSRKPASMETERKKRLA